MPPIPPDVPAPSAAGAPDGGAPLRSSGPVAAAPPPIVVRAERELSITEVRELLAEDSRSERQERLGRLGIVGPDAEELIPLAEAAAEDPELLEEITGIANRLRSAAGLHATALDLEAHKAHHDALQRRLTPGEGLIPVLALTVSTDTVRAWHAARGLAPEQSEHVLSDLGQQMRVHRAGTGLLGLHQLNWVSVNWAGRLVHLGRLQFDLHRRRTSRLEHGLAATRSDEPERWVVGTHIPATGPLDPTQVDASFDAATAYFGEHYADLDDGRGAQEPRIGHEFVCDSWLLSDQLAEITGEGSNLARFAARWDLLDRARMDDGALFFVFGQRPPADVAALPRRTRLEQGVADRLADGRGWTGGTGRLLR